MPYSAATFHTRPLASDDPLDPGLDLKPWVQAELKPLLLLRQMKEDVEDLPETRLDSDPSLAQS